MQDERPDARRFALRFPVFSCGTIVRYCPFVSLLASAPGVLVVSFIGFFAMCFLVCDLWVDLCAVLLAPIAAVAAFWSAPWAGVVVSVPEAWANAAPDTASMALRMVGAIK
jgi:hypothetical protein